jgi:hypothetical protein
MGGGGRGCAYAGPPKRLSNLITSCSRLLVSSRIFLSNTFLTVVIDSASFLIATLHSSMSRFKPLLEASDAGLEE